MSRARIVSVHAGRVAELPGDEPVRTAYRKHAVAGRARVLRAGLEGDAQAHADVHGGPDRAILAYPAAHYRAWEAESLALPVGSFGENLVLEGLDEGSTCIGDVYRVGTVLLEVSVPRTPCAMISIASGVTGLSERVVDSGRTGWLCRVLEEGELQPGDEVIPCGRPNPTWTVTRAARVMRLMREIDPAVVPEARALADVEALAAGWRRKLRERADAAVAVTARTARRSE